MKPAFASPIAAARPMPLPAPVTSATLTAVLVTPSSSSRYTRMISSKSASAWNPSSSARRGSNRPGQPATIRVIVSSGSSLIKRTAPSPAMRRNASICSATVAETPGIVRQRRSPSRPPSSEAACRRKPTAERGDAYQCRTSSGTGSTASCPFNGSRMIPEKNPDAARLGGPGRTQIVGSRTAMPSRRPRRL